MAEPVCGENRLVNGIQSAGLNIFEKVASEAPSMGSPLSLQSHAWKEEILFVFF